MLLPKKRALRSDGSPAPDGWGAYLEVLRNKWDEVPAGKARLKTTDLELLDDERLLETWTRASKEASESREWYRTLYAPILKEKAVLDVGSGFGIDGIAFAQKGTKMTFLDIAESNLRVLRRLCKLLDVQNVDFCYLQDEKSLERLGVFDVMWCQGSMICAPFEVAQGEARELLKHLKPQGRWIELAYPKARWEREGKLPFEKWGKKTDGWAPWIEWYDVEKLYRRLHPAKFKTVLNFEFHNHDFIWFDLARAESL